MLRILRMVAMWFVVWLAVLTSFFWALVAYGQQGPIKTPQLNTTYYVGQVAGFYPTIQSAVTTACATAGATVDIPAGSPADGTTGYTISAVTGGCAKVGLTDGRVVPAGRYTSTGGGYTVVPTFTLPSGTPGQFLMYQSGGTVVTPTTLSRDCTVSSLGLVTCLKTNNVPFAASATSDTTNASNITTGVLGASEGGTGAAGSLTGYTKANGTSPMTAAATIPSTDVSYPAGIQNQVLQYLNTGTNVAGGGFLAILDLANCSTAYLYNEGTGTVTNNKCATGPSRNGTIIGSPAWSQYGLVLNPATTGQAVQLPASENTAHTFELAAYFPYFGTSLGVNWGGAVNFPGNQSIICSTNSNLICFLNWNPATGPGGALSDWFQAINGGGGGGSASSAQPLGTGWHTFAFTCGVSGTSVMQQYIDGVPVLMNNTTAMCPTSTGAGIYQIGGSSLLTQTWQSMILAGSVTYQAERTATQIAADSIALLNYVKSRGQAGAVTPAYTATNKPKAVLYGDSRSVSVLGPSPFSYMVLNDTNAQTAVVATSGQLAADICSTPTFGVVDVVPKVASRTVAVVWIDINDIINGGNNTMQIAGYDSCITKNLKATGASVLFSTEIDATGYDAGKNAINTYILQMAKQWGADGVIALNSFPSIGADGAGANLTYFAAGGLHPQNTTNQNIIGVAFQNAINELWGSTSLQHNKTASASYQQLAQDDYLDLTGTAAQTITLPDCQGYTHERYVFNASAFSATIVPASSGFGASFTQTINGISSFALPAGASVTFGIVPGALSTGGCSWQVSSSAGIAATVLQTTTAPLSLTVGSCGSVTTTLTGVTQTMALTATPQVDPGPNTVINPYWTAANTVITRVCTGGSTAWAGVVMNLVASGH